MQQRTGEERMFIYDLHRGKGDLAFLQRAEMQQRDMARIKVWRMLWEKRNLILGRWFSLHAAGSALHESPVDLQRHRKGSLSGLRQSSLLFSAFSLLSFHFLSYFHLTSDLFISPLQFWLLGLIQRSIFLSLLQKTSQCCISLEDILADSPHLSCSSSAPLKLFIQTFRAPWCGPCRAPLYWGWCLIKPVLELPEGLCSSDPHLLWRLQFTQPTRSIISYLSLRSQ